MMTARPLVVLFAAVLLVALAACSREGPTFKTSDVTGSSLGRDFTLTDHTGKTRTLQLLTEGLSANGVPVFITDIKGDLTGLLEPGQTSEKLLARTAANGQEFAAAAFPVELYSLGGQGRGVTIRTTVTDFGPLLLARAHPGRVAGLVTIAAAPDFTEDSMWAGFTAAQRAELATTGQVALPSDYSDDPYIITRRLIDDGRSHLVLRGPLHLPFPVRFLQGTADKDVPVAVALRLLDHASGPDIGLALVKGADHRFSTAECLRLIEGTVQEVLGRV